MAGARFPEQFNTRESLMKLTEKVHLFWESSCESLWNRYNKKGPCIRCLNLSSVYFQETCELPNVQNVYIRDVKMVAMLLPVTIHFNQHTSRFLPPA